MWRGRRWTPQEWQRYERAVKRFDAALDAQVSRLGRKWAPEWSWEIDARPSEPDGKIRFHNLPELERRE